MEGMVWIQRHGIALFTVLAPPVLGVLWWNHSKLTREVEELNRLVRQIARAPANEQDARHDPTGA